MLTETPGDLTVEPTRAAGPARADGTREIPGLSELRGLAILMVLACHLATNVTWRSAAFTKVWRLAASMGWVGVDLFFVLSGFLITGILLDTRRQKRYFYNFYGRRLLRIFPLYYLLLVVTSFLSHTDFGVRTGWATMGSRGAVWYWGFLANVPRIMGWSRGNSLDVAWSLAIEEQFYLIWPIIVLLLSRRSLIAFCALLIALSPVARYAVQRLGMDGSQIYFFTPCRIDGLAAGAMLAALYRDNRAWPACAKYARIIATAGIIPFLAMTVIAHQPMYHWNPGLFPIFTYSAVALFFGSTVLFVLHLDRRTPQFAMLRFLGKYSFSIYLFHMSVFAFLLSVTTRRRYDEPALPGRIFTELAVVICTLVITILLARMSWVWIESPCLSLKRNFSFAAAVPATSRVGGQTLTKS